MLTLGIETSGQEGSIALVESGVVLAEVPLSLTGRRHARTLVAELKDLLREAGRSPGECECVAVSIGPGSFTGLRVGVVCAKTFAYATGSQVVGVDTLEAIAAGSSEEVTQADVLVDAMRGELFTARYIRGKDRWSRQNEISIVARRDFDAVRDGAVPASGPALANIAVEAGFANRLDKECWTPQARNVALIGESEATTGRSHNLWTLEPLYIRRPAAEEQAKGRR